MNEDKSRPVDVSDELVQALAVGQVLELGGGSRPRALTDDNVKSLSSKGGSIESFAPLASADSSLAASASSFGGGGAGARPRDVSAKDVENLAAGKALDISQRPVLAAQQLGR